MSGLPYLTFPAVLFLILHPGPETKRSFMTITVDHCTSGHLLKVGHDPKQQILCQMQCRVAQISSLQSKAQMLWYPQGGGCIMSLSFKKLGMVCVSIPADVTVCCDTTAAI